MGEVKNLHLGELVQLVRLVNTKVEGLLRQLSLHETCDQIPITKLRKLVQLIMHVNTKVKGLLRQLSLQETCHCHFHPMQQSGDKLQ